MPFSLSLEILIMPLHLPLCPHSLSMFHVTPETIKHWIYFMQTQRRPIHQHPSPPLGRSDHNLVHLLPVYKPLVCRQPATSRTVTTWSDETDEALKDCFETTIWEELCNPHGDDIDSLTDCITDYINFCVENTVPTRTVRCFPNNKP